MSDLKELRLSVHLSGGIPSAFELAAFIELLGGSLVWAGLSNVEYPDSYPGTDPLPRGWELKNSFESFLSEKYESAVLYGAAGLAGWLFPAELAEMRKVISQERYRYRATPIDAVSAFVLTRSFPRFGDRAGTCRTHLTEVVAWSHERFGRNFLPIDEIRSTHSIDVIFSLVHLAGIFGLQSRPLVKDLVEYVVALLQNWVGQRDSPKRDIIVPQISKPMRDLMAGYDNVELEIAPGLFRMTLDRKRR